MHASGSGFPDRHEHNPRSLGNGAGSGPTPSHKLSARYHRGVALFAPACPVTDRERGWIDDSTGWFRSQFGDGPLSAPVIAPASEYFPPPFSGTDAEVRDLVAKIAGWTGVQSGADVGFTDDYDHGRDLARLIPAVSKGSGAAGFYTRTEDGRPMLTIDRSVIGTPIRLVAVIAHELAHVRLIGEGRITADREDNEPLTDLATVYLGMGIFNANAAFHFSRTSGSQYSGWRTQRLGYLTEQMFGYGLARYAVLRGEPDPRWGKYLDTNPRSYMKKSIRYLRSA